MGKLSGALHHRAGRATPLITYPRPGTGATQPSQSMFPLGQQASQPPSDDHVVPAGQQPVGAHWSWPPGQQVVPRAPVLVIEGQQASSAEKRQQGSLAQSPVPQQAWPAVVAHQPSLVQMALP